MAHSTGVCFGTPASHASPRNANLFLPGRQARCAQSVHSWRCRLQLPRRAGKFTGVIGRSFARCVSDSYTPTAINPAAAIRPVLTLFTSAMTESCKTDGSNFDDEKRGTRTIALRTREGRRYNAERGTTSCFCFCFF